jgi:hypothetical protein
MKLDPTSPYFFEQVGRVLDLATAANTTVVLSVDPACLLDDTGRARLRTLLTEGSWRGGVLVPVDSEDQAAAATVTQHQDLVHLTADQQQRIAVRTVLGASDEVRVALVALIDDIAARIVKQGEVQRLSPDNPGPARRPTITNAVLPPPPA